LNPRGDSYLFLPQNATLADEYEKWPKVSDIFTKSGPGMTTAHDGFVVDFDRQRLALRMRRFRDSLGTDDELHELCEVDRKMGWSIRNAWRDLQTMTDADIESAITPLVYRPFDNRWIFYRDSVVWRTVRRVMLNLVQPGNVALVVPKRVETSGSWQHCFVADVPVDHVAVSLKTIDMVFPLYASNPDEDQPGVTSLMMSSRDRAQSPNLNPGIWENLASGLGFKPTPGHVLAYIYAVLYSAAYRTRYAEFLKTDFPRIPFTKDRDTFIKLVGLGQQLIDLHLMRSPELDNPISRFCGKGDSAVTRIEYDADRGCVTINPTQYFDNVAPDLWSYQIGGYQVLAKWLKDRKGRFLTATDTQHYSRIVTALARTLSLQSNMEESAVSLFPGKTIDIG
jgi:predicted helicase